jgi:hypothetical protein
MTNKEGWSTHTFDSTALESFSIAFNKLTSAQKIITTKTIYSFWCTNSRHRGDRGEFKECCFCGSDDEDWIHILMCNGTGAKPITRCYQDNTGMITKSFTLVNVGISRARTYIPTAHLGNTKLTCYVYSKSQQNSS